MSLVESIEETWDVANLAELTRHGTRCTAA